MSWPINQLTLKVMGNVVVVMNLQLPTMESLAVLHNFHHTVYKYKTNTV